MDELSQSSRSFEAPQRRSPARGNTRGKGSKMRTRREGYAWGPFDTGSGVGDGFVTADSFVMRRA